MALPTATHPIVREDGVLHPRFHGVSSYGFECVGV